MNSEAAPAKNSGTYEFPSGPEDPIARISTDLSRFGEHGDLSNVRAELKRDGESFVDVEAETIRISLRGKTVHYQVVNEQDQRTGSAGLQGIDMRTAPNPYDKGPTIAQMIHQVQKDAKAGRGGVLSTETGRRLTAQVVLSLVMIGAVVMFLIGVITSSLQAFIAGTVLLGFSASMLASNARKLDRSHRRSRKPLIEVIALPREERAHLEEQVHLLAEKLDLDQVTKIELRRINRDTDLGVMDSSYVYFHGMSKDRELGGCWVLTDGFAHSMSYENTVAWLTRGSRSPAS